MGYELYFKDDSISRAIINDDGSMSLVAWYKEDVIELAKYFNIKESDLV